MKLEPVITEKTTNLTKARKYTFRVDKTMTKSQVRELVSRTFGVKVIGVATVKEHGEFKRGLGRKGKIIKPSKKAIVTLAEKQKIDLFETKKK